jgi:4-diphosphocytidyl-2-C-methyl-D-erythritol kinase
MHVRPRAKVNLTLSVGERGRDGYHPLHSTFVRVGLSDQLTVAFGNGEGSDVLTVSGLPGCTVEGNLVLRAFAACRAALGLDLPPLVAHLDKRIPIAAGLGGGSADAAAAVDAALQIWGVGLSPELLDAVSLELGADVPFFAHNLDAARVSGRGEVIEPVELPASIGGVLLVAPPIAMSTAAVFASFDEVGPPADADEPNDLWPAAVSLAPALAEIRGELERRSGRPWQMSGSGSTLFATFESVAAAASVGRELVASESEVLGGALFAAVDLIGPDPEWRYS